MRFHVKSSSSCSYHHCACAMPTMPVLCLHFTCTMPMLWLLPVCLFITTEWGGEREKLVDFEESKVKKIAVKKHQKLNKTLKGFVRL